MTASEQTFPNEADRAAEAAAAVDAGTTSEAGAAAASSLSENEPDALRAQLTELRDKLLRSQAECANVAKRWQQQHREDMRYGGMGLARDLLGVLDGFQRTLATIEPGKADDPHIEGVRLVSQQLEKVLRDHGVSKIESLGKAFDPSLHEALMQDMKSDASAGTVVSELEPGYRLHDRVLRHAKVVVAGRPSEEDSRVEGDGRTASEGN